ncbi:hypothetical protein B0A55_11435 [Friedmanniomyces simplex]|uniref:Glycosyl hydrolase family 32 C-terminal domain-containing protein n=1 Tax=Friedmanniomyces simplex TaxID=329884 RepID=A0A4U0WSE5_9PEZI|nr:hypothetical protein B0A55_11435 [Friedmanniomyces simplex]
MKVNGETWFARYMLANVHRELGEYDEAIGGLEAVLKERRGEFGVQLSLLQTFLEKAWRCLDTGLYGEAVDSACQAFATAANIVTDRPHAFNLWKAIGDACLLFSWLGSGVGRFPAEAVQSLLDADAGQEAFNLLADVDRLHRQEKDDSRVNGEAARMQLSAPLSTGILAYKRAIASCAHDVHAQAVAWYNLGWAEQRACLSSDPKAGKKYLRAAVRCFKRAIELEAGNAEFWNALGVVTTTLNPKVAQHAFVRSLHLNELNAKVWTNLGVLYLLENDHDLAHSAFGRAQSTDPDYGHAWVGEGLIALLLGDSGQALNHFTHAFEISDSASTIVKRQYALSSFDHLLAAHSESSDVTKLIQPVFALEQLRTQVPEDLPYRHLAALFLERVGNRPAAVETLTELCVNAEAEYEQTESVAALARFAHAKSDLARCQLAASDFDGAAENAETALDLTIDADNSGLDVEARTRLRLSSHLTAGLAAHSQNNISHAISMFRAALQESNSNPDAVCLLVKVLWAHGGSEEKTVARDQLFGCVERQPEYVGSVTLLGAIAALDDDKTTSLAVKEDLLNLRMKDGLHMNELADIEGLLSTLAALRSGSTDEDEITEAQTAILLKPNLPDAWSHLSELSGEVYAAQMALKTAQKAVPPSGEIEPAELARAFARIVSAAAFWLQQGACATVGRIEYNVAPPNLSDLFNNSLFYTWRPRSHVLPPDGQVGDPCMHYTDPNTGLFHVGYLHDGAAGATTSDLVRYVDVNEDPTFIRSGGINDPVAVFDGSVIPSGINGTPTLLYTSVSYLPIQWTIPYTKGSETQSLAVTYDGGKNFSKVKEGPVIPGPPFPVTNVTGFRDPYVFQSPQLDRTANSTNGTWYTIISGGIHGQGPSQFLFRQYDAEYRDWEYLGQWWHEPANSTWGDGTWAGRWGYNFEVGNIFTLDSEGYSNSTDAEFFTTLGAEWSELPIIPQVSQFREMLWASGNVSNLPNGSVHFTPTMAGKLDWGVFAYAAAGKLLPATSSASQSSGTAVDRFIIYLWLTNDDFGTSAFPTVQQGWNSVLTTVRELSRGTISNVLDDSLVQGQASWRITSRDETAGTVELVTLNQTIVREVRSAFISNATRTFTEPGRTISTSASSYGNASSDLSFAQSPGSKFFMLTTTIHFPASARNASDLKVGLRILSSDYESTSIYYQFANESLIIDRSNSSAAAATTPGILTNNEAGRLRLFNIASGANSSAIESLALTVVVDNSVVEVYANDRFVLSTWVWSWFDESTQISFLHEGTTAVTYDDVVVYEGLVDAWPSRP